MPYSLYHTAGCHLCELAEEIIQNYPSTDIAYQKIDIAIDDALIEKFGVRIPVLEHSSGLNLDWPFTEQDLHEFIQKVNRLK